MSTWGGRSLDGLNKSSVLFELMNAPAVQTVEQLRRLIHARTPMATAPGAVRSSGLSELDRLLEGGFPKSALTVLTGVSGAGRMTIAARILAEETRHKRPVAWVDARGALYPPALELAGVDLKRMLMVRGSRERSLYALEQILASGAFGVVVGSGLEPFLSQAGLRRVQTATEGSGATTLLVLEPRAAENVTMAALKLRVMRRSPGIQIEVEKSKRAPLGKRMFLEAC